MRVLLIGCALCGVAISCKVGQSVKCPGASYNCAGNQCCQDGTTCPSASNSWHQCPKPKTTDCTNSKPDIFSGRCGIAVTESEAQLITANGWLNDYDGSIGFWYNWGDKTSVSMMEGGAGVPFLPMWWGSQDWKGNSWCSNAGSTPIEAASGAQSVAFAWNEPLGGAGCQWSMGACPGGDYSGTSGATRAAQNYGGCVNGAKGMNRLVSTPCLNNLEPDWFRSFVKSRPGDFINTQAETVCCSHIYATQYNGAAWDSCDINAMTNLDKLAGELQSLVDDGTCDHHFIQEIGIGGCQTAGASASELLIQNLGNAVRNMPSVYLGWFSNSAGAGGTSRATTWLFEENTGTVGAAYQNMCKSLVEGSFSAPRNESVVAV